MLIFSITFFLYTYFYLSSLYGIRPNKPQFLQLVINSANFVVDKKCLVIKRGEKFKDYHSGLTGTLYVIKRQVLEEFRAEVPGALPSMVVECIKEEEPIEKVRIINVSTKKIIHD